MIGCTMAPPQRRTRWPAGLLGMLALVAATEWTLERHDPDFTQYIAFGWRDAGRAARREATRADVLILGDSQAKLGLAPRVVEARTGKTSYNLAIMGGQPPSSYVLLRRALEAGANPSAIVLDCAPRLLALSPHANAHLWGDLLTPREALDLALTARDSRLLAWTLVTRYLTSIRRRDGVRAAVLMALRGQVNGSRGEVLAYRRNWRVNHGAQLLPRDPTFRGLLDPNDRPTRAGRWRPDPVNTIYLRRLVALAAGRGIPVFWAIPPTSAAWQADRQRRGLEEPYTAFARRLAAELPTLTVIDGRRSGYRSEVFVDPIHLDVRGASALSAALADVVVAHRPGGPRWVELPPFQEPTGIPPLEDVARSRLARLRGEGVPR